MTDLPADAPAPLPVPAGSQPGRFAVTFKSSLHRAGRWRVPEHLATVVYKGDGVLDLRAAELTAHVTTISAVAYKSRIDILVPPGVRVETGGLGVSTGSAGREGPLSPNAPVVHVRGYSYKGTVAVAGQPGSNEHDRRRHIEPLQPRRQRAPGEHQRRHDRQIRSAHRITPSAQ
jgi:hypothetical protein